MSIVCWTLQALLDHCVTVQPSSRTLIVFHVSANRLAWNWAHFTKDQSVAVQMMRQGDLFSLNQTNQTDVAVVTVDGLLYARTELTSGFILAILSPITVGANVLLIMAIFKDPLHYFKTPTTHFVLGLSIADVLCGFFVEPFFAVFYLCRYFGASGKIQSITRVLYAVGSIISTASLNSSFVMVLLLSVAQLIAIEWPYKYKTLVRKESAIAFVVVTWVYFTIFSFLPMLGIQLQLFFKVNVILHATLISLVLSTVQILVYRSYRRTCLLRQKSRQLSAQFAESHINSDLLPKDAKKRLATTRRTRSKLFDRNFTIMTFYLAAILLFAAFPHICVFYVFVFKKPASSEEDQLLNVLLRITDLLLFTKAATDAFIFAWRLPTYRKSLHVILGGKKLQLETDV